VAENTAVLLEDLKLPKEAKRCGKNMESKNRPDGIGGRLPSYATVHAASRHNRTRTSCCGGVSCATASTTALHQSFARSPIFLFRTDVHGWRRRTASSPSMTVMPFEVLYSNQKAHGGSLEMVQTAQRPTGDSLPSRPRSLADSELHCAIGLRPVILESRRRRRGLSYVLSIDVMNSSTS
jgi:hypothetical protein